MLSEIATVEEGLEVTSDLSGIADQLYIYIYILYRIPAPDAITLQAHQPMVKGNLCKLAAHRYHDGKPLTQLGNAHSISDPDAFTVVVRQCVYRLRCFSQFSIAKRTKIC